MHPGAMSATNGGQTVQTWPVNSGCDHMLGQLLMPAAAHAAAQRSAPAPLADAWTSPQSPCPAHQAAGPA